MKNKQMQAKDATRVSISLDTAYSEKIDILIQNEVFKSRAEVVRAGLREIFAQYVPLLGNAGVSESSKLDPHKNARSPPMPHNNHLI